MSITVFHRQWEASDLMRISEQYALPARFEATVTPDSANHPVSHLRVVIEGGRPVCDALTLERQPGGPPVSGDSLRRVPVAEYVSRAVDQVGYWIVERQSVPEFTFEGDTMPVVPASIPYGDTHVAIPLGGVGRTAEYKAAVRAPRIKGGVNSEMLREVADVYKRAHGKRQPPTQAVMTEWDVTRATASRWVRRAREHGFLGAARPRTAGEF